MIDYDFVSEYYLAWCAGLTDNEIAETTKEDLEEWLTGENSDLTEDFNIDGLAERIYDRIQEEIASEDDEECFIY